MSQENVEVVRRVYAEWELGNLGAGVELFDPEIVFESFMPDSSERVVVHGPKGIENHMREALAQLRDFRLVAEEFREVGNKVFVAGHQAATGRQSGVAVEAPIFSIWTFRGTPFERRWACLFTLRAGKLIKWTTMATHAEALEAAGLSE